MKVQLYILGFLKRHGSQHGYALKQLLSKRASDFAKIKMSNIYYHFEKMEKQGIVKVSHEKEGKRPDRQVYTITPEGEKEFLKLLVEALKIPYDFESIIDGPLFFSEYIQNEQISESLKQRISHLEEILEQIDSHQEGSLRNIPEGFKKNAEILFSHHRIHFAAELSWTRQALKVLRE